MRRGSVVAARLLLGLATLVAVAAQLRVVIDAGGSAANFFSYFTILSNLLAALVFLGAAAYLALHREPVARDDLLRGASVLYMAITGIIYATLLSKYELGLTLPWVNAQLHFVMPAAVVVDWLYQPQRTKLTARQTWWWLGFPLAFLVYSLVRGPIAAWYPYPFLDPNLAGGYGGVALYSIAILAVILGMSWVLRNLGNRLRRNVA